jgi:hypothetical protein
MGTSIEMALAGAEPEAVGLRAAAVDVLAVSQKELTRLATLGYDKPTEGDRLFRQTPNYHAVPWPVVSGPQILQTYDPNNMHSGRDSVQAAHFAAPFDTGMGGGVASGGGSGRTKPLFHSAGLSFSPDGDLAAMYDSSFLGSDSNATAADGSASGLASSSMFADENTDAYHGLVENLMSSIAKTLDDTGAPLPLRGNPAAADAFQPDLGGVAGSKVEPMRRDFALARSTYGTGTSPDVPAIAIAPEVVHLDPPAPEMQRCPAPVAGIGERFRLAVSGILYDLAHYSDILLADVEASGFGSTPLYVLRRDSRLPYVGLCLSVLLLFVLLLFALF